MKDRIKKLRMANRLTQRELAQKVGVTPRMVSQWETGKRVPDIKTIYKLIDALSCTVPELLKSEAERRNESLWYMTCSLKWYYKDKPEREVVEKIAELLRMILKLEQPDNGGVVGLGEGWLDMIQEAANHLS